MCFSFQSPTIVDHDAPAVGLSGAISGEDNNPSQTEGTSREQVCCSLHLKCVLLNCMSNSLHDLINVVPI